MRVKYVTYDKRRSKAEQKRLEKFEALSRPGVNPRLKELFEKRWDKDKGAYKFLSKR